MAIVAGLLLAILGTLAAWVPIPTGVTSPALIRYLPETNVRAGADGFVSQVHVSEGEWVRRGELLVELDNVDLVNKLKRLEITWQQNEIRAKQASSQGDAASHRLVRDNQIVLEKQIATVRQQVAGLRIKSPRDGYVIAHDLGERTGTFVKEGDFLMNVAREQDKEIVAVIDQHDIQSARQCVGRQLTIRAVGFRPLQGTLDRIEPRASQELQETALGASVGGPLAVEPNVTSEASGGRLLEPHFRGRIVLKPVDAIGVAAGLRTYVALRHRQETTLQKVKRLVDRALDGTSVDVDRRMQFLDDGRF